MLTYLRNRIARQLMQQEFDPEFYLEANPDVRQAGVDPFEHFLEYGWKENRDPTPDFSVAGYLTRYSDVRRSGQNPYYHYLRFGRKLGRNSKPPNATDQYLDRTQAFQVVQDMSFPIDAVASEKVMVIVIPEHNEMSGGIYSFFSIAKAAYKLRRIHGYRVLIMTRPNRRAETYIRQRNFRNAEDVYRFEQIVRCVAAKELYIHIPEYAAPGFFDSLSPDLRNYLVSREKLYLNILNQKQDIMPERDSFEDLFSLTSNISMSVAHHAYFGQQFADRYGLPMLLLPAYTDLSEYEPSEFSDKEDLIIYSPDSADFKQDVLRAISEQLPHYNLQEIRGISFDEYMERATRCRFSITFGEGFDGYLAQPIYQGGIGFAVFNEEFFPSEELLDFINIFKDPNSMVRDVVARIRLLESDPMLYNQANQHMMKLYNRLYSRQDYLKRVEKLLGREFEIFPSPLRETGNPVRL